LSIVFLRFFRLAICLSDGQKALGSADRLTRWCCLPLSWLYYSKDF